MVIGRPRQSLAAAGVALALVAGCRYTQRHDAALPFQANHMNAGAPSRATSARAELSAPDNANPDDTSPEDTTDTGSMPAESYFKNIRVFRGMSVRDVSAAMSFMSASLGVRCSFCHAQGDFSLDDKPAKRTARSMVQMTREINAGHFGGTTVTCFTCHRGNTRPAATPAPAHGGWAAPDLAREDEISPDSSMTAERVLSRYVREIGGEPAVARIISRVVRAVRTQATGAESAVEVYWKSPSWLRRVTTSSDPGRGTVVHLFDGRRGWALFAGHPANPAENAELEFLVREAEAMPAAGLASMFTNVRLLGRDSLDGREVYVVAAQRTDRAADRLYFDIATGLLVRRYITLATVLGPIPLSLDYADYRVVDGVSVPFSVRCVTLRETWTETITELRNNVAIADTMFAQPK